MEAGFRQHLAAILAADAVGYTRLMQADENATVAALDQSRLIFREHIEAEGGRVVDTAGDSVLAVFETATGAVRAAKAVQEALGDRNADQPDDRRMDFRIGVTLGEIIEKPDGTIYGDGVNIAARLEAEAEPGGIVISGTAFDSVRGKVEAGFTDLGEHAVKNVDAPVRMYRVEAGKTADPGQRPFGWRWPVLAALAIVVILAVGFGVWRLTDSGGIVTVADAEKYVPAMPTGPSIAVLPFENLSGDPDQDYFSDGLTEDVIAALGRFSNLSVLARNATVRFKGTTEDPAAIGRALGVGYIFQGSVRRAGERIAVSTQLIDAAYGRHLWSNKYETALADLFDVQADISQNVVGQLAVKLTQVERERTSRKPTENLEAYDLVLRGWELLRRDQRSDINEARQLFIRALELDPQYADAYTGLAAVRWRSVVMGFTEFVPKGLAEAEDLANQALTLDPQSVNSRMVLAYVHILRGEYTFAVNQLRRALEINPSDAASYKGLGAAMLWSGHEDKAIEWLEAALRFDPEMESRHLSDLALAYYLAGHYEDALRTAREANNRQPDNWATFMIMAAAFAQMGQTAPAEAMVADLLRVRPFFTVEYMTSGWPDPNDVAHLVDGLGKAGLTVP